MENHKHITREEIIDFFIDFVEKKKKRPHSLKELSEFSESSKNEFKTFYTDVFEIEQSIYQEIFKQTILTLESDEAYQSYDSRLKLLSFYYTFFENINLNNDFFQVLFKDIKSKIASLSSMGSFKKSFKDYLSELHLELIDLKVPKANQIQENSLKEIAYTQLLLTLQFWATDDSENKEKTDVFIEKSVNTSFDLLDTSALKSVFDLGKFVITETFKK